MIPSTKTWKEKWIAKEEGNSETKSGSEEGHVNHHREVDVNMVFHLTVEFGLPEQEAMWLELGAVRAVFEKPQLLGGHTKLLYIKGHIDGMLVNWMLVDGGACVNILPCSLFKKLCGGESELMRTNMTLNGFYGEASEAKGIVSKELTVGSKMIPTAFFVVEVKEKYNILLGRDWIHANGCILSTLHQCVIQWVDREVEVVTTDDTSCVAVTEMHGDLQDGEVHCLLGRDLSDYDYVSIGQHGFVTVNVKPTTMGRLENVGIANDE
jgi:hypothetical protein